MSSWLHNLEARKKKLLDSVDKAKGHVEKAKKTAQGHIDKVKGHIDKAKKTVKSHSDKAKHHINKVKENINKVKENINKSEEHHDKAEEHHDKAEEHHDKAEEHHEKAEEHHEKAEEHHEKAEEHRENEENDEAEHHEKESEHHEKESEHHEREAEHHEKEAEHHEKEADHHERESGHHEKEAEHFLKEAEHHEKEAKHHNFLDKKLHERLGEDKSKELKKAVEKIYSIFGIHKLATIALLGIIFFSITILVIKGSVQSQLQSKLSKLGQSKVNAINSTMDSGIYTGLITLMLWILLVSMHLSKTSKTATRKERFLVTFEFFSLLSCLFFSTIVITYFWIARSNIPPAIDRMTTGMCIFLYLVFLGIVYYFVKKEGENEVKHSLIIPLAKLGIMFLIIIIFFYLGGVIIYANSQLDTNDIDRNWVIATIVIYITLAVAFVIYVIYKILKATGKISKKAGEVAAV